MNNILFVEDDYSLVETIVKTIREMVVVDTTPEIKPYLHLNKNGLFIVSTQFQPINIESIYLPVFKRLKDKNEFLVQITKNSQLTFDLTAGFGRDAMLMAKNSKKLVIFEQNPFLATILTYALEKEYLPKNTKLIYANSLDYIASYNGYKPDIIYLDPMFEDKKNAKAPKEMQIIQAIIKPTVQNNEKLVELALHIANKVIVKRDNKSPKIGKPSFSVKGKTIRYDVYLTIERK